MALRRASLSLRLLLAGSVLCLTLAALGAFAGQAQAFCFAPKITSVTFTPAQPLAGQPDTIEVSVSMASYSSCTASFSVHFRPEASSTVEVSAYTIPTLAPGESTTVSLPYTFQKARPYLTVTELVPFGEQGENSALATHDQTVTVLAPTLAFGFQTLGRGTCEDVMCTTPEHPVAGEPVTEEFEIENGGPSEAGPFSIRLIPNTAKALVGDQSQSFAGEAVERANRVSFKVTYAKPGTYTAKAELLPKSGDFKTTGGRAGATVEQPLTVGEAGADLSFENPEPDSCDANLCAKEPLVVDNKDDISLEVHNKGPDTAGYFAVKLIPHGKGLPAAKTMHVKDLAPGESRTLTFPVKYPAKGTFTATAEIKPYGFKNIGSSSTQASLSVMQRSAELDVEMEEVIAFHDPAGYEEWDLDSCIQFVICVKKHEEPVFPGSLIAVDQYAVVKLTEAQHLHARLDVHSTDYTCVIHCFFEHDAFPGHATVNLSRAEYLKAAAGPVYETEPGKECREEENYLPLGPIVFGGECFVAFYKVELLNHVGKE
jgi:hypothetical protein